MNGDGGEPASPISQVPSVAHYYGDPVRQLFLAAAALSVIAAPFFPGVLPFNTAQSVLFIVVLVVAAALTNPKKRWTAVADAVIAAYGVIVVESFAIDEFSKSSWPLFFVRELLAIAFLFALYYSVKTIRAMVMHQLGKSGTRFGEFGEDR